MKHIVILIDQLYNFGGIERLVALKANYWTSVFGYKVTILSTEQKGNPKVFQLNNKVEFLDLGINYDRSKSYFGTKNLAFFLKNIKILKKQLNVLNPDFILVASHIPMTYFIPFIRGKSKVIKEFHFTKYERQRNLKFKLFNFFESKYDYLVVLSKEERQFYDTQNVVVIPNPLTFPVPEKSLMPDAKDNKAIFVGRVAPVKNLEGMIHVWKNFIVLHPNWKLEIYGSYDDVYGQSIRKKIVEEKMTDHIFLMGSASNIMNAIESAKVMLMTSHQECFPMVILESFALGVPVYAFNCPTGPRNIIKNDKNGCLIENGNITEFVNELDVFVKNEDKQQRMSKFASETAEMYSLDIIMQKWNEKIFLK
ncbi:MAG: glycosyltransferase [Bacteroidota bacterium]